MTHRYSFGIFPDDWTDPMRLRQRVQGTVQLHRARLTDPTLSLVTFADLHTSLDATLTAAGVPDGCEMALGMLLMALAAGASLFPAHLALHGLAFAVSGYRLRCYRVLAVDEASPAGYAIEPPTALLPTGTEGFLMTGWEYDVLEEQIKESKALGVSNSRAVREIRHVIKASGLQPPRREPSAAQTLIASIARQVQAYIYGDDDPGVVGGSRTRDGGFLELRLWKAATSPAMTTTVGYAAELAQPALSGVFDLLTPDSAYVQLSSRGMKVSLDGASSLRLPMRSASGGLSAAWIAEGAPIPVKDGAGLSNASLALSKVGVIAFFSEELAGRSIPTIESVIRAILAEDLGTILDSTLLGAAAATAVKPAGLLFNVTPILATAGGGAAACAGDVSALLAAISPAADPVLLMNEAERVRMIALAPAYATLPVLATSAMAAKTVAAIDAAVLVTAEGDNPSIAISKDAVLHAENTTPLPIGSGTQGSGVLAVPSTSLFQSDLLAIRLIQFAGWVMRDSGKVAVVNSVTW